MKRLLVLLPLLLVGCTNDKISDNSHTISNDKVFYNVYYDFDFANKYYRVFAETSEWHISPSKVYLIELEMLEKVNGKDINNEFFVTTNELFVYYVK